MRSDPARPPPLPPCHRLYAHGFTHTVSHHSGTFAVANYGVASTEATPSLAHETEPL
mgnify:FL=1